MLISDDLCEAGLLLPCKVRTGNESKQMPRLLGLISHQRNVQVPCVPASDEVDELLYGRPLPHAFSNPEEVIRPHEMSFLQNRRGGYGALNGATSGHVRFNPAHSFSFPSRFVLAQAGMACFQKHKAANWARVFPVTGTGLATQYICT